jgi:signal transduction histidine kinase
MPSGHLPVRSYLAIPVVSRSGEVWGGLFFGHPEPGIFTERAERLVLGIAAQAAVALDNARLYEGVQRELVARRQADQALRESESRLRNVLAEREGLLESERAARSEAEHLSQMKDEFLATLSHELRTPLNSIQGWVGVLRSAQTSAQDQARGLETIDRNVRAQAQLVSDLLDMSRIISGKIHLEVQTVYLHEVINAALDSVLPSAEAKGIRVTRVLDTEINPARGDPDRLQQVLWNLLSNAVKFTPRGGRIQVILERVNSHAEIVVEDSGIGMQPEFLPHVFDRFRQADAGISRRYSGLGIGLSIVKSLVELHGGSVRVKSPGENQGSTFIVSLPIPLMSPDDRRRERRLSIAASRHDADDAIELPRLDGINVLLVDDDADSLALAVRVLEERGAHTVAVGGGIEALKVLRERHFDILLSDIGMPDIDGYELIQRVREFDHERGRAIPAIALTAYARLDDRQRSLLAGYQMHIAKPVDARELIAGIASLLRVSR